MSESDVQPAMDSRPASPRGRQTTVYLAGELLLKSVRDSLEIEQYKERLGELNGKLHLAERRLFMAEHEAEALNALAKMACGSLRRAERAEEEFGLAEERARLAEAEASQAAERERLAEAEASQAAERVRLAEARASREELRARLAEAEASQAMERERLAEDRAGQAEERARLTEAEASQAAEREKLAEDRASQAEERAKLAEAEASQAAERERLAEDRASREELRARFAEAEASQAEKRARFAEAKASRAEERARLAEARASRAEEGRKIAEKDVRSADKRAWQKGKQAMEAEEKIRQLQDKMQTLETELAEARRQINLASHRAQSSTLLSSSSASSSTSSSSTSSPSPPGFPIVWRFHTSKTESSLSPSGPSLQGAVSGAVARGNGATSSSSLPSTYVWDLADLKPFTVSGGPTILGSGCYGTVYLHRHRSSGTPIAVKTMILPDCPRAMKAKVLTNTLHSGAEDR
ncbi:uncharacterized protein [Diadema setosum]|uniref:uncharacterized protein n=1 Tax=Diadema setosum TaxID=31175 RepID=UPI003B3A2429